jgi:hypothetical protein
MECPICYTEMVGKDELFEHKHARGPPYKCHAVCMIQYVESSRSSGSNMIRCPTCRSNLGTPNNCIEIIETQNRTLWKTMALNLRRAREHIPPVIETGRHVLTALSPINEHGEVNLVISGLHMTGINIARDYMHGRNIFDPDYITTLIATTAVTGAFVGSFIIYMRLPRGGTRRKNTKPIRQRGGLYKKGEINFKSPKSLESFFNEIYKINEINLNSEPYYIVIYNIDANIAKQFLKGLNINSSVISNV